MTDQKYEEMLAHWQLVFGDLCEIVGARETMADITEVLVGVDRIEARMQITPQGGVLVTYRDKSIKGSWIEIPVSKSMWRLVAVAAAAIADAEEEV